MNSVVLEENQASWQCFFEFVFPEEPKLCEKEPFGVDATVKQPNLTGSNTEIQTKLYTGFKQKPLVVSQ